MKYTITKDEKLGGYTISFPSTITISGFDYVLSSNDGGCSGMIKVYKSLKCAENYCYKNCLVGKPEITVNK